MRLILVTLMAAALAAAGCNGDGVSAGGTGTAAGTPEAEGSPPIRAGLVTMGGRPITLVGTPVGEGDEAPDVTLVGNDMQPVSLSDYEGRTLVVATVPSLDTGVCDRETRRFNELATQMGPDVTVLTISRDLPFAQRRWCGAAGVENVTTLSDFREGAFGERYGVLIAESGLLARAVFVIDRDGVVRYVQIVPELGQEPDYDEVLFAVQDVLTVPARGLATR